MLTLPGHHSRLERRTTWIWGSHRSGSTWLLNLLCHPAAPAPDRSGGFRAATGAGRLDVVPIEDLSFANHLAPALGDPVPGEGGLIPGTINNLMGNRRNYLFSPAFESSWRPAARRLALERIDASLEAARSAGMQIGRDARVVIKEVSGTHASDIVMRVLPDSRLLFLIRDGRDVVDSILHAYQPGGFLARTQDYEISTPEQREQGLRWAARSWAVNIDVVSRAIDAHDPDLVATVRYEDLLTDTAGELERLFDWMGLDRDRERIDRIVEEHSFEATPPSRVGPTEHKRSASPGMWRDNLSPDEQAIVSEIIGERLVRFGYDPSTDG